MAFETLLFPIIIAVSSSVATAILTIFVKNNTIAHEEKRKIFELYMEKLEKDPAQARKVLSQFMIGYLLMVRELTDKEAENRNVSVSTQTNLQNTSISPDEIKMLMEASTKPTNKETVDYFKKKRERIPIAPRCRLFLGRDSACEVIILDENISHKHAAINSNGKTVFIEDMESLNGTFVNWKKIVKPVALKDGDIINLGNSDSHLITFKMVKILN